MSYIADELTIETLQAAEKYYRYAGEPAERLTIEQVKKFIEERFLSLLDCHFNDSFARGDILFARERKELLEKFPLPEMDDREREKFSSALWGLFASGYRYGYEMGIKDAETFLHTLKEVEEAERQDELDELL